MRGWLLGVGLLLALPATASEFCDGFTVGYKEGFCYGDGFCSPGFVPHCPFQQPGERTFRHGYNRGIMMSVDKKLADRAKLAEQRRPPPERPGYSAPSRASSQSSMSAFAEGFNRGVRERQAREQREAEMAQYQSERDEYEREQRETEERLASIDASLEQLVEQGHQLAARAEARYQSGQPSAAPASTDDAASPQGAFDELVRQVQAAVPDQVQLDSDPAFEQFMDAADPASGTNRQMLLEQAVRDNDAARVIAFYTTFKSTVGTVEFRRGYDWARENKPTFEKCITEGRPEFEAGCIQFLKERVRKTD